MTRSPPLWRRHLTFFGRDIRRDLEEELEFHIEARSRELVDAGWPPRAAEEEARRLFGNRDAIFEECRQIDTRFERKKRMLDYLGDVAADVRFALRQFRRQPKFWTVIVLTLVVGISTSTAIFAVVDGILLQPLPYRDPGRLVHVMNGTWKGIFHHLAERTGTLDLAAYNAGPEITLGSRDGPLRLSAATVSPELFQVLGVAPALGRAFTPEEGRPGSPAVTGGDTWRTYGVVVLSYGLWQTYFGGDPNTLGRSVDVSGVPHTIVGVMPAEFDFPSRETALWLPMSIEPGNNVNLWGFNAWSIVGRLRDGVTLDAAQRETRALIPTFGALFPPYLEMPEGYGARVAVRPLHEMIVGSVRAELLVLLAAIGTVFLILCVNVANLLLARGLSRDRELATRAALGAGRPRLVRQLFVENVTVSIVAGVAGTLAAVALLRVLASFLPADLPRVDEVQIDARVLVFALALSVGAALVFGLLPALRATRSGATLLTRATGGLWAGRREGRITAILVSVEFALAVVLVVSAALLAQSLWNLSRVDPGFRVEGLVSARFAPPDSPNALNDDLLARLRAMPGVAAAAIATSVPFGNDGFGIGFGIDGRAGSNDRPTIADVGVAVTPGYLSTLGIPLVEGRELDETDRSDSVPVALVSESLARAYWGDASPIGARIQLPERPNSRTVIGVVGDTKWSDLSGADPRVLYLPLSQHDAFSPYRRVVVRTDADPALVAGNLRAIVGSLDADTPVSDVRTSSARISGSIARPRFAAHLLAGFAAIALLLACIGIYGTLSYAMSRRIPEIGVRLALGATGGEVFGLLFRQGLRLTLVGISIGIPLAVAATRLLTNLLFGVDPANPWLLAIVAVLLLSIGLAVSYPPALRAGKIDPMVALRHD